MPSPIQGSNEAGTYGAARYQQKLNAQGLLTENYPGSQAGAASPALISGTVYYLAQGLLAGDVVTGFGFAVGTIASGLTLVRIGMYNKANQLIAQSLDLSATAFLVNGKGRFLLSAAGFAVPASDGYYGAVIAVGTTPPVLKGVAVSVNATGAMPGSTLGEFGSQAGQADLPATAAISFAGSPLGLWQGVY